MKIKDNVILSEVVATHRAKFFITDLVDDDEIIATHMNIAEKIEASPTVSDTMIVRLKCRWNDKKREHVHTCNGRSTFQ
jgi:hypothetical protein